MCGGFLQRRWQKNIVCKCSPGLLGQITTEVKTVRVCHRKIEAGAGRTDGSVWNFHEVLVCGCVGIENMYVQILRCACENDLLATLIQLDVGLFVRNSPIYSNAWC